MIRHANDSKVKSCKFPRKRNKKHQKKQLEIYVALNFIAQ